MADEKPVLDRMDKGFSELRVEMSEIRGEMKDIRFEMKDIRRDMQADFKWTVKLIIGTIISVVIVGIPSFITMLLKILDRV